MSHLPGTETPSAALAAEDPQTPKGFSNESLRQLSFIGGDDNNGAETSSAPAFGQVRGNGDAAVSSVSAMSAAAAVQQQQQEQQQAMRASVSPISARNANSAAARGHRRGGSISSGNSSGALSGSSSAQAQYAASTASADSEDVPLEVLQSLYLHTPFSPTLASFNNTPQSTQGGNGLQRNRSRSRERSGTIGRRTRDASSASSIASAPATSASRPSSADMSSSVGDETLSPRQATFDRFDTQSPARPPRHIAPSVSPRIHQVPQGTGLSDLPTAPAAYQQPLSPRAAHFPGGTPAQGGGGQSWAPHTVAFTTTTTFPAVKRLPARDRKRILVTGGAGFVGSHLVDRLMCMGHDVIVLDNFFSGTKTGVSHWIGHPSFELVRSDVVEPFMVECDQIYHLACPASPKAYQKNAVKTLKTNFLGTMNMLGLAKRTKARFLLSSTSEVYGSPEEHPQRETYWGHVNPIGPRACYDEGKRVAEALTYGYHRQDGVDVRVARIFNCFGPRMAPEDGRLISSFVTKAIAGDDIVVHGNGQQTRALMYIHDLVTGLIRLMDSDETEPVNLGTDDERTVLDWAIVCRDVVKDLRAKGEIGWPASSLADDGEASDDEASGVGLGFGPLRSGQPAQDSPQHLVTPAESEIVFSDAVADDPPRRCPDTTRAREILGWTPSVSVKAGIEETVRYFWRLEQDGR